MKKSLSVLLLALISYSCSNVQPDIKSGKSDKTDKYVRTPNNYKSKYSDVIVEILSQRKQFTLDKFGLEKYDFSQKFLDQFDIKYCDKYVILDLEHEVDAFISATAKKVKEKEVVEITILDTVIVKKDSITN